MALGYFLVTILERFHMHRNNLARSINMVNTDFDPALPDYPVEAFKVVTR